MRVTRGQGLEDLEGFGAAAQDAAGAADAPRLPNGFLQQQELLLLFRLTVIGEGGVGGGGSGAACFFPI